MTLEDTTPRNPIEQQSEMTLKISNRIEDLQKLISQLVEGSADAKSNDVAIGALLHTLSTEVQTVGELFETLKDKKRNPEDNQTILENTHEVASSINTSLDTAFQKLQFLDNLYTNTNLNPKEKMQGLHESTFDSDEKTKDTFATALQNTLDKIRGVKATIESL
ncbi:MAG: hypothetical protein ACI83D_000654 [Planctomycetota bacterium]|jgi:hypothetical protein